MIKSKTPTPLIEKIQTAIISIATTAIVANCGFLFKVNAILAKIEQRQLEYEKASDDQKITQNKMLLDIADLKITTTRLEAKQNIKTP